MRTYFKHIRMGTQQEKGMEVAIKKKSEGERKKKKIKQAEACINDALN